MQMKFGLHVANVDLPYTYQAGKCIFLLVGNTILLTGRQDKQTKGFASMPHLTKAQIHFGIPEHHFQQAQMVGFIIQEKRDNVFQMTTFCMAVRSLKQERIFH